MAKEGPPRHLVHFTCDLQYVVVGWSHSIVGSEAEELLKNLFTAVRGYMLVEFLVGILVRQTVEQVIGASREA